MNEQISTLGFLWQIMKKILLTLLLALFVIPFDGHSKSKEPPFQCELEMAEIGKAGSVVAKLWVYSKNKKINDETIIKNAILGICFNGVNPNESRRMHGLRPLIEGEYENYREYFDTFFSTHEYYNYVRIGLEGYAEQGDLIKVKKKYKIGRLVVINLSDLRKRLENDNIINSLTNGF